MQLFERRAKMVKAKEENHWKQVTPDMMSEEEDENGEFIRHRPQWRYTSFFYLYLSMPIKFHLLTFHPG